MSITHKIRNNKVVRLVLSFQDEDQNIPRETVGEFNSKDEAYIYWRDKLQVKNIPLIIESVSTVTNIDIYSKGEYKL